MEVFLDKTRFRVLNAGRRWGKTILAVNELLRSSIEYPGSLNWYVAPTYRQAKMIAWEMCKRLIPKELIESTNEVDLSIKLINKSRIELRGAENEDSLRGVGLNFAVLDENAMMKRHVWPTIIRPMLADTKGGALFISTPRGKDSFWELWVKGQRGEDGYKSWTFKTEDNPFIDRQEVDDAKKELSDRFFKQEFEASFEDYTGLIWPEFNESEHVHDPFTIPAGWSRRGAIDTAISGITAAIKGAIDYNGCLWIYSEYYESDKRVSEIAPKIKENGVKWYIDPASQGQYSQREGRLYSLYDEFRDHGIVCESGENNVDYGINRVAEAFKASKIRIFSTCKNLIHEIQLYHWAEDRIGNTGLLKPTPYKEQDHLCDCLRYVIASRPKSSTEPGEELNPNSAYGRLMARRKNTNQEVYH
jgi:hypothetical protein